MDKTTLLNLLLETVTSYSDELVKLECQLDYTMNELYRNWSKALPEEIERWDAVESMIHHIRVRSYVLKGRLKDLLRFY